MLAKLLLYGLAITINLYFAQKRVGRMKLSLQIAAAMWAIVGVIDIATSS